MLLITGTQRTGTSFVANFCKQSGYDLGTDFWHSDINGGLESPDICKFYRDKLGDPTFPFSDFDEAVNNREYKPLRELNYDVQKFSYMLMNPQFVDMWFKERGNQDRLLILMREAEKVCKSKTNSDIRTQRFSTDSSLINLTPNELKQNWYDSFCRIMDYEIPFTILKFPNYMTDYNKVYNALNKKGGLDKISENSKLWNSLFDDEKISVK